jgi:hypothetical protein
MEPEIECSSKEKLELERLAIVKMRAESGDKKAKIQWKRMSDKIASLKTKAKAGDPKAKRSLLMLKQNGFFQPIQKFAMSGDNMFDLNQRAKKGDVSAQIALRKLKIREEANREEATDIQGIPFVRDEVRAQGEDCSSMGDALSHNEYRALVIKQAVKNASGKKPETKHFFAAKVAVDRSLGKSGVSIFIPGAKPGRRTV